tara:strand:+ start:1079 stop:1339 length:261 start_codon:yes stop_codon:yes gene_type:complete
MNIGYPDTKNKKGSGGPLLKTNPPGAEDALQGMISGMAPMLPIKPNVFKKEGLKTTIKDNTRKKPNMPPKMNYNLDVRKTPTIRQI